MINNRNSDSSHSRIMREGGNKDAEAEPEKEEAKKEEPVVDPKKRPEPDQQKDYVDCLGCC